MPPRDFAAETVAVSVAVSRVAIQLQLQMRLRRKQLYAVAKAGVVFLPVFAFESVMRNDRRKPFHIRRMHIGFYIKAVRRVNIIDLPAAFGGNDIIGNRRIIIREQIYPRRTHFAAQRPPPEIVRFVRFPIPKRIYAGHYFADRPPINDSRIAAAAIALALIRPKLPRDCVIFRLAQCAQKIHADIRAPPAQFGAPIQLRRAHKARQLQIFQGFGKCIMHRQIGDLPAGSFQSRRPSLAQIGVFYKIIQQLPRGRPLRFPMQNPLCFLAKRRQRIVIFYDKTARRSRAAAGRNRPGEIFAV